MLTRAACTASAMQPNLYPSAHPALYTRPSTQCHTSQSRDCRLARGCLTNGAMANARLLHAAAAAAMLLISLPGCPTRGAGAGHSTRPLLPSRRSRRLPLPRTANRAGGVQREAQRRQRRGQPRRHQRQLLVELRRGGRARRQRRRAGAAAAPDAQLHGGADAVAGDAHDRHGWVNHAWWLYVLSGALLRVGLSTQGRLTSPAGAQNMNRC